MPMYLLWGVLKVTCFTGKTLAILLILSISLFTFIGKTSMLVLLINAFLAIKFDLRYYTWKTNDKAIAIVAVEWLSCVVLSSLLCLQVFYIDFGNATVTLYHHVYVAKNLTFVRIIMFVFIVSTIVFGVLVLWSMRRRKLHVCLSCFFTSVGPSAGRRESCFCVANFSYVSISPSLRKYICRLLNQKMLKLS